MIKKLICFEFLAAAFLSVLAVIVLSLVFSERANAGLTSSLEKYTPEHYTGFIQFTAPATVDCLSCPPGWNVARTGAGFYRIDHNLNLTNGVQELTCGITPFGFVNGINVQYNSAANQLFYLFYNPATAGFIDGSSHFLCIRNKNP